MRGRGGVRVKSETTLRSTGGEGCGDAVVAIDSFSAVALGIVREEDRADMDPDDR